MRHTVKACTYFVTHFIVALGVAYALTGDLAIALSIGLIEPTLQTGAYAIHERVWEKLPYFSVKAESPHSLSS